MQVKVAFIHFVVFSLASDFYVWYLQASVYDDLSFIADTIAGQIEELNCGVRFELIFAELSCFQFSLIFEDMGVVLF